jgi:cytochrome b
MGYRKRNIARCSTTQISTTPALTRIRLWDLPTRIFHWLLAIAVTIAFITGKIGGDWLRIHGIAGVSIVGLIVFRVVWGITGSTYARFTNFAPSLASIRTYIDGQWRGIGHNPLGALAVFALLTLLAAQACTGLFANDDIGFEGPLCALADKTLSNRLTGFHRWLSNVLLTASVVHVLAIGFYLRFKKENLLKPMLTGWKENAPARAAAVGGGRIALIVAIMIAMTVVYGANGSFLSNHASSSTTTPPAARRPTW